MKLTEHFRLAVAVLLVASAGMLRGGEPPEAFRGWSSFEKIDLAKLARGKIATECNASMDFARGLSAQAAYVVAASPAAAVRVLVSPDPARNTDPDICRRRFFHSEAEAEFAKLVLDAKSKPVRALLEAMRARDGLHLSREEIMQLPAAAPVDEAQRFWAGVARRRWSQAAQHGDLGATDAFNIRNEIASLLKGEGRIARHFSALLAPLTQAGSFGSPAAYYWDVADVNHIATLELGAIFTRTADDREQVLDVAYYAGSGYLVSVTLYELAPVTIDGQPRTLVWQGCLVSAPALAGGFGVKRQIASHLMTGDLEESARAFQKDAAAR